MFGKPRHCPTFKVSASSATIAVGDLKRFADKLRVAILSL